MEPVAPPRAAPMYVYQNIHHPNSTANLTSLSMAGTLPVHSRGINELSIPVSRYVLDMFFQLFKCVFIKFVVSFIAFFIEWIWNQHRKCEDMITRLQAKKKI